MIPAWIVEYAALLGRGLQTTLTILLIASVLGYGLAVLVALARISKNKVIAKVSLFYTSVTRGTPLLIQIYIFYYGLGSLFAQFPLIRGSFLWPYLRDGYWYIVFALGGVGGGLCWRSDSRWPAGGAQRVKWKRRRPSA